jgi:hypothetical protein
MYELNPIVILWYPQSDVRESATKCDRFGEALS